MTSKRGDVGWDGAAMVRRGVGGAKATNAVLLWAYQAVFPGLVKLCCFALSNLSFCPGNKLINLFRYWVNFLTVIKVSGYLTGVKVFKGFISHIIFYFFSADLKSL